VGSSKFGRALTLGVEEELFLVDPETRAPAGAVERVLGPPGLKTELFSCLVETNTPICETPTQALTELERLRRLAHARAGAIGLELLAGGSHPFARGEEQEIVQEPRYLALLAERPAAVRQLVCGLHVHVGMESLERCLERLEAVLPWLPAVLALSLNSPWLEGAETGALSARAARLLELPRCGAPPRLDGGGWERAVKEAGEPTKLWWDVRPHPKLGTLEVRVADQQTNVQRSAGLVALVQALVVAAEPREPLDRDAYLEARSAAATGDAPTAELLALVEPAARTLGSWELVEILEQPPEAYRQLELGRREGLVALADDLAARSR
jgi:glutamate---cysteine ligase / carboxylate-amine ligase